MSGDPQNVLVFRTGNSCRSVMAEALINELRRGRYKALSGGEFPAGYVHPKAIETLSRHGIDPRTPQSNSWGIFATISPVNTAFWFRTKWFVESRRQPVTDHDDV